MIVSTIVRNLDQITIKHPLPLPACGTHVMMIMMKMQDCRTVLIRSVPFSTPSPMTMITKKMLNCRIVIISPF